MNTSKSMAANVLLNNGIFGDILPREKHQYYDHNTTAYIFHDGSVMTDNEGFLEHHKTLKDAEAYINAH